MANAVTSSSVQSRLVSREAWGLFALFVVWHTIAAARVAGYVLDEVNYGVPTVREVLRLGWPLHFVHAPYGFPLVEWLAAPLFAVFGPDPWWLRLPNILLAAAGTSWFFLQLAPELGHRTARLLGIFLACPHGLHLIFVSLGSTYGPGILVCAAANALLHRATVRAGWKQYATTGMALGLLNFVFPQVRIYIAAWMLFQFGPHAINSATKAWDYFGIIYNALICTAVLLLMLASYHYLTRPTGYKAPPVLLGMWTFGGALTVAFTLHLAHRWRFWQAVARRAVMFAVCFLASAAPLHLAYAQWQRERLDYGANHDATQFSLKHAHEWPRQAAFFSARVIPHAFWLPSDQLSSLQVGEHQLARGSIAVGAATGVSWLAMWLYFANRPSTTATSRRSILWWGFLVVFTAAMMIPSWYLAEDLQSRYLTLVSAGLWLPVALLLNSARSRVFSVSVLAAILAWNAYDAFIVWPAFWTAQGVPIESISR